MDSQQFRDDPLSLTVLRCVFLLVCGVFAALTVVTHVAQFCGMSFRSYAWVCLAVAMIVGGCMVRICSRQFQQMTDRDWGPLAGVIMLGLAGTTIALMSHRPDADDYFYVPNAVYCLENPANQIGFEVHGLYSLDHLFRAYTWSTSLPFEYVQAVVAHDLRVPYPTVYYLASPAISGFLVALALFYLVARFADTTRDAAWGTAVALVLVTLLGETHRTFGNFSYVRIFQGKVVCMAIGIPLFAAATIDLFRRRQVRDWALVAVVIVAMLGLTSSTIILFPALSIVLTISMATALKDRRPRISTLAAYASAYGYLLLYTGICYVRQNRDGLLDEAMISPAFPGTFSGHFHFIFDSARPVTGILLLLTTALSIGFLRGWRRRALVAWVVSAVTLYLNPWAGNALIRLVPPLRDIYWRLFYIYPFPLVAGIAFSAISLRLNHLPEKARVAVWGGIFAVLVGCHFIPGSTSSLRSAHMGWPRYKLPTAAMETAHAIISVTPKGPMLAPREISGVICVLTSGYPPLRNGTDDIEQWLLGRSRAAEARQRIEASNFVDGDGGNAASLENILTQLPVRSVVVKQSVFKLKPVDDILARHNFLQWQSCGPYVVTWKE